VQIDELQKNIENKKRLEYRRSKFKQQFSLENSNILNYKKTRFPDIIVEVGAES
jgi:hypothetical protein